jgi:hypothetical protein
MTLIFGHERWRQRMALLAYGALTEAERAATEAHVQSCPPCARELSELSQVRALIDGQPLPPLPVSVETLEARVLARLAERPAPVAAAPAARPWVLRFGAPLAAAAALAVASWVVVGRRAPIPASSPSAAPEVAEAGPGPAGEEVLRRMERLLAREQAARYLNEAQDVLVTVTAGPSPCPKGLARVEVEDEARQRSRALLARRASLGGPADVASAEPVLAEVEQMLREVADLPSCVRPGRLQALQREVGRRRLLMKIDLMTRELQG